MMTRIPRVFHRVWLGGSPIPAQHEACGRSWTRRHPNWEMITWTEANLPRLRNQREFDQSRHLAQRAALARYEILERYGGVYVDTDFECLRNIEPLLGSASFVAGWQDSRVVNNAFIASVAQHVILTEMINRIPRRIDTRACQPITAQSGVGFFTEVATSHAASAAGVVLVEPALLYPYHWQEPERATEEFPDAYAVHHWEASWVTQ